MKRRRVGEDERIGRGEWLMGVELREWARVRRVNVRRVSVIRVSERQKSG